MALVACVTYELVETVTNQPHVRVSNQETLQIPGLMTPHSAELIVAVFARLGEDVQDRSLEQARQLFQQQP
jgi:hypothetical protein